METCISYVDDRAYVSTDERKLVNRLNRLGEEHPEDVHVLAAPEINYGCLYVSIPANWVRIAPPRKVEYSDEQRAAMAERMQKVRLQVSNGGNTDE